MIHIFARQLMISIACNMWNDMCVLGELNDENFLFHLQFMNHGSNDRQYTIVSMIILLASVCVALPLLLRCCCYCYLMMEWIFYLTGLLLCMALSDSYLQHATSKSSIKTVNPLPYDSHVQCTCMYGCGKIVCRQMENSNMQWEHDIHVYFNSRCCFVLYGIRDWIETGRSFFSF